MSLNNTQLSETAKNIKQETIPPKSKLFSTRNGMDLHVSLSMVKVLKMSHTLSSLEVSSPHVQMGIQL